MSILTYSFEIQWPIVNFMVPEKKNFDVLKKDVWVVLHFRWFWEFIKQL